jgi:hypothetical protein
MAHTFESCGSRLVRLYLLVLESLFKRLLMLNFLLLLSQNSIFRQHLSLSWSHDCPDKVVGYNPIRLGRRDIHGVLNRAGLAILGGLLLQLVRSLHYDVLL